MKANTNERRKRVSPILQRITELRTQRGWSEYRLAEYSGVAQSTISSWYQKSYLPSLASLEKICAAFGISLSQFFAEVNGEPISLTAEQRQLLEKWRTLSQNGKTAFFYLLSEL